MAITLYCAPICCPATLSVTHTSELHALPCHQPSLASPNPPSITQLETSLMFRFGRKSSILASAGSGTPCNRLLCVTKSPAPYVHAYTTRTPMVNLVARCFQAFSLGVFSVSNGMTLVCDTRTGVAYVHLYALNTRWERVRHVLFFYFFIFCASRNQRPLENRQTNRI